MTPYIYGLIIMSTRSFSHTLADDHHKRRKRDGRHKQLSRVVETCEATDSELAIDGVSGNGIRYSALGLD